jgi:hypothetical protein
MIIQESIQSIQGVLTLIQTVIYSNGKTVKRIIDPHSKVPLSIIEEKGQ